MKILPCHDESSIKEAADVIHHGGVVAVPTDTFYGLAVDPLNIGALVRLLAAKGRDEGHGILLLLSQAFMMKPFVSYLPADFDQWDLWPCAVTFLLPARPGLPLVLTGGSEKIGIRTPDAPVVNQLCNHLGHAITGTSANRSGTVPATCIEDMSGFAGDIDAVIDGGRLSATLPSTIVDLTGPDPVLVRPGAVSFESVLARIRRKVNNSNSEV